MMAKELEQSLQQAFLAARLNRHEVLTTEHLLLALIDNRSASEALAGCGVDVESLRKQTLDHVRSHVPVIPENVPMDENNLATPTLGFQRVMQRAILQAQSSGITEVQGANILLSLFAEKNSQAVALMEKHGINQLKLARFMAQGTELEPVDRSKSRTAQGGRRQAQEGTALTAFASNLNALALEGKIDPLIGRQWEIERVIQTLCRRSKNNPLLVGDAGVGKTAIAEGLARRIVDKEVPEVLAGSEVWALDMGALVAGTKFRGEFEQRLTDVIKELKTKKNAILFIDEIHTLIGAGAGSSNLDASNMLKPALAKGDLKCIGATTHSEFRQVFEKDHALSRRFQMVQVGEPSIEETTQILEGLKEKFEAHHGVKYTPEALRAAAELSARYINDRHLPDKAIDVIDEVGAAQRIAPKGKKRRIIKKVDIEQVVAKIAKVPPQTISKSDKVDLKNLEANLKTVVYGQDEAIEILASTVKMARSGLGDPNKPVGNFLFAGPTGVGKTEVAKQLAKELGIELVRFDMSEYMEAHAVSRLIGAPPGYVGYEKGGLLTEAMNKTPHCVLLLDEIEKAHPDIYNILLQVMDHGALTDNNGRQADFKNAIIVLTTNAGASDMAKNVVGFNATAATHDNKDALSKTFTPEFRNRLDAVVTFGKLNKDTILKITDKFLGQLATQLKAKNVNATFTDNLRHWLAEKGYDPKMGARPMARLIQDTIRKALADELLFGKLEKGGSVEIDLEEGKVKLNVA